jgi:hypothetical protein
MRYDDIVVSLRDAEQQRIRQPGCRPPAYTPSISGKCERWESWLRPGKPSGLQKNKLDGLWVHLDADVLDDEIMPAVDYRLAGGLQWDELSVLLRTIVSSGQAVGMNIGIFNPRLDKDGTIARQLVKTLIAGLVP